MLSIYVGSYEKHSPKKKKEFYETMSQAGGVNRILYLSYSEIVDTPKSVPKIE